MQSSFDNLKSSTLSNLWHVQDQPRHIHTFHIHSITLLTFTPPIHLVTVTCACHDSHHMTNQYHSLPIPHPSLPQNASVEDRHSQTTFIPSRLNNYTNMYAGTIICRVLLKHNHFKSLRCLKLPCQAGRSCSLRRSKTAARSDGLKHPLPITMMTDRA